MRRTAKSKLQRCHPAHDPTKPDGPGNKFFGCYLLTSLSPRYKGHSYIGFTVDPKRRIRQHNGEITSGAVRTKRKRPWEMVFCIHGFPSHVAALQFEWAWQHPKESLAVRQAASTFKTLGGLANKIKLALTMLTLPSWHSMDLTVSFFSTKYMKHTAGSPSLPQMKIHFCPMDELPCYSDDASDDINSTHNTQEDVADISHDTQVVSSIDAIVNASASSIHIETSTTENVRKDMWTENSTVEEDEQLFWSLPTDIIQPGNTIWKERSQSFHQTCSSNKQVKTQPLLEEEIEPYCQSPGNNMNEQIQLSKEMETHWFPLLEDLTVPFDQAGASISMGDGSSKDTDKFTKKDDIACILIDDNREEQRHSSYVQPPGRIRDNVVPSPVEGIEVIDLFTPSPECRIISGNKKRRVSRDHPDFIDLTRSPVFVQL